MVSSHRHPKIKIEPPVASFAGCRAGAGCSERRRLALGFASSFLDEASPLCPYLRNTTPFLPCTLQSMGLPVSCFPFLSSLPLSLFY